MGKKVRFSKRIAKLQRISNRWKKYYKSWEKYYGKSYRMLKPEQNFCPNCCTKINPRGCYFNNNTNTFVFLCLTCNIKLLCHLEDYLEKYLDDYVSPRENDHIMEVLLPEIA